MSRRRPSGQGAARSGATGALVLALLLTGCTATSEPPPVDSGSADTGIPKSPVTDRMVDCLSDAGWEATRSWSGGFEGPENLPVEQDGQYQAAVLDCGTQTGWATAWQDLDREQISELYEQELAEAACLEKAGYSGPEAPTEQSYADGFHSENQYYAIRGINPEEIAVGTLQELTAKCPPPTWFLNIDGLD